MMKKILQFFLVLVVASISYADINVNDQLTASLVHFDEQSQNEDSVVIFDLNQVSLTGHYFLEVASLTTDEPARMTQNFAVLPNHVYMVLLNGKDIVCNFNVTVNKPITVNMIGNTPSLSQKVMCTANNNEIDIVKMS